MSDPTEQSVLVEPCDVARSSTLHHLREHRGRRLRDRAAAARELHLVDRLAVLGERDVDRHLVAAERILPLGYRVRILQLAVTARVLVVIEDYLSVHLVELIHANTLRTVCRPLTS